MFTLNLTNQTQSNKPGFVINLRKGRGKETRYERLGVAWKNEDRSFFIELDPKSVITGIRIVESKPTANEATH